jgi:fructokinase
MTGTLPTVTCIGELLWDVLPAGRVLGGAPANCAYHLAQLGLGVRLVTRLGRDELGAAAIDALQSRGLPTADVQWDERLPTGAAHVSLDPAGHASYRFVTPAAWDAIAAPAFDPEVVVFGSLAQRDPRSAAAVRGFAARAAVRVFDVNLRPPFTRLDAVIESLPLATLLKVNDDEAAQLASLLALPASLPEFAAALAARHGHRVVCITRGAAGAAMWTDGAWYETAGVPIVAVDTVGAGDAFLAALIRGWLAGEAPQHVLETANRRGASVAARSGAM